MVFLQTIFYGKSNDQQRRELVVQFGEQAVNKAEQGYSKFVGPVNSKILFSKHFKAACQAAKL